MALALVPLATLTITMGRRAFMPGVPGGSRVFIEFSDVKLEGERIKAHKAAVAAVDSLTIGAASVATLDIRMVVETHDGAAVFIQGAGRTDAEKFAKGGPLYFTPLFETGDARYAWLNGVQGIAKGRAEGDVVTFELFEAR